MTQHEHTFETQSGDDYLIDAFGNVVMTVGAWDGEQVRVVLNDYDLRCMRNEVAKRMQVTCHD